jgi:hypothetical protein
MIRPGWERVICIASGPSFDEAQAQRAARAQREAGWRVIVVSDNWRRVPSADAIYSADAKWWRLYHEEVRRSFAGEKWTQIRDGIAKDKQEAEKFGLFYVRTVRGCGLAREPGTIRRGGNSGHQAIELAYLFSARLIVLIGYDMCLGPNGEAHWFGDHPKPLTQADDPSVWIPGFEILARDLAAAGVHVINASADTALRCFERSSLEEALESCPVAA